MRAEGRGRKDLFLLKDKSLLEEAEREDMGDGDVIQGWGSVGHEVFAEEMTVLITRKDRV